MGFIMTVACTKSVLYSHSFFPSLPSLLISVHSSLSGPLLSLFLGRVCVLVVTVVLGVMMAHEVKAMDTLKHSD